MDIVDRVKEVIKWSGLSQRAFSQAINFSVSTLNNYLLRKRETLDSSLLVNISSSFDDISTRWLLTGEGEMLREVPGVLRDDGVAYEPYTPPPEEFRKMIEYQREIIKQQKDLIQMLQEQLKMQQMNNGLNDRPDAREDDAAGCADASGW